MNDTRQSITMDQGSYRIPPMWSPDDHNYSFQDWKADLLLWRAATDVPTWKHGALVAQRLQGPGKHL